MITLTQTECGFTVDARYDTARFEDLLRAVIEISSPVWPNLDDRRHALFRTESGGCTMDLLGSKIQPCAIVEFGRANVRRYERGLIRGWRIVACAERQAFLHILDDEHGLDSADLITLANALRP